MTTIRPRLLDPNPITMLTLTVIELITLLLCYTDPFRLSSDLSETELRAEVKAAGGRWNPKCKIRRLAYGQVVALGLEQRIVKRKG